MRLIWTVPAGSILVEASVKHRFLAGLDHVLGGCWGEWECLPLDYCINKDMPCVYVTPVDL